jgi:hypothetical protein
MIKKEELTMICPRCSNLLDLEIVEWGYRTDCKNCWMYITIQTGVNPYK